MLLILLCFGLLAQIPVPVPGRIRWRTWLAVLLLCETGLHGFFSICNNGTANRNIYEAGREELRQVLRTAPDAGDYRTDIFNPVLRNEELLYGLNGISMFSSTNTDAMQAWMEKTGFETGKNRFQYTGGTELMDMLLGIRYLACRNTLSMGAGGMVTPYEKLYDGNWYDVYRNPRALQEGYLVDGGIQKFRLEGNDVKRALRKKPENVRFAGYVEPGELKEAYCGADAFAFFSQEETEGIVVLEALACQAPVVVRDIPVYEDWLTDGVQVCKAVSLE